MNHKTILLLFLAGYCFYQLNTVLTQKNGAGKIIDEHIETYIQLSQFSDSFLIDTKKQILLRKGYGLANYEFDNKNNSETKFIFDALRKEFTAVAIMKHEENNLFSVDDKYRMMHFLLMKPSTYYIPLH